MFLAINSAPEYRLGLRHSLAPKDIKISFADRGGNCHGFANRCRVISRRKGLMKGFREDFAG
ncbi:MAG: hypothetical protein JXJ04_15275 [Spirochaetales bacterium]|nr:hypothetical protein [Spirochaetales bacterium]